MTERPRGFWTATLTPQTSDGSVAIDRLAAHCKALAAAGCDGFAPFGTTGEGPSFSVRERQETLDGLLSAGIKGSQLIPGTGTSALSDTIALTRHATAAGCAGVLMLPPFFFKDVDEDGVYTSFARAIEGVGRPDLRVYLYNIPQFSGVAVTVPVIARLRRAFGPVIAGIKDSAAVLADSLAIIKANPDFTTFIGCETDVPATMLAGGSGTICGIGNIAPRLIRRLVDSAGKAEQDGLIAETGKVVDAICAQPFIPAMKAVLAEGGHDPAWENVRPPLNPLGPEARKSLLASFGAQRGHVGLAAAA